MYAFADRGHVEYVRHDIVVTGTNAIAVGFYQDLRLIERNTQSGQGCV